DDPCQRGDAQLLGGGFAHEHHGGGPVGDGRSIGGGDGAILFEGRLEGRDLLGHGFEGRFILIDDGVALASGNRHRSDFPVETAVFIGGAGPAQRLEREVILLLASEGVLGHAALGENAHRRAALVGVFEAVERHVVVDGGMAVAVTLATAQQKVRRVAHAFLAAGDDYVDTAGHEEVVAEHGGLHAGSAHLVDGGAGYALGK